MQWEGKIETHANDFRKNNWDYKNQEERYMSTFNAEFKDKSLLRRTMRCEEPIMKGYDTFKFLETRNFEKPTHAKTPSGQMTISYEQALKKN